MKSVSWWRWLCIGLLAVACSLATTGCDDDDDDKDATPTPAVDDDDGAGGDGDDGDNGDGNNDDGEGGGEEEVGGNPEGDGEEEEPDPLPPLIVPIVAPNLVSPGDGDVFNTDTPGTYNVTFKWASVAGAATYIVEINGAKYTTSGTSLTKAVAVGQSHSWNVRAKAASALVSGPPSDTYSFEVRLVI